MPQPSRSEAPHPLELIDDARARREQALPDLTGDPASYLAHLSTLGHLVEVYVRRLLKPHGIGISDHRVLSTLRIRPRGYRATPQDLNRVAQITSAGMTRTLDRLEAAGYLDRVPNPDDRRSVLVGLTDAGWELAEAILRDLYAQLADVVDGLGAPQRKAEIETLRAIISRLAGVIARPA